MIRFVGVFLCMVFLLVGCGHPSAVSNDVQQEPFMSVRQLSVGYDSAGYLNGMLMINGATYSWTTRTFLEGPDRHVQGMYCPGYYIPVVRGTTMTADQIRQHMAVNLVLANFGWMPKFWQCILYEVYFLPMVNSVPDEECFSWVKTMEDNGYDWPDAKTYPDGCTYPSPPIC